METNNLTEKLNTFTSLVIQDAREKREKLLEDVEKEYSKKLDESEIGLLQGAYENIQQNIHEVQKDANARILHAQMEARKKLILKREEIINEIMENAKGKLIEFAKSEEYKKWLPEKIENALNEVGKGSKIVYISPDDMDMKEQIEQISQTSKITVEATSERGFIGGAKVLNTDRKVSVDYSFGEMLSSQKHEFLQSSGLTLD